MTDEDKNAGEGISDPELVRAFKGGDNEALEGLIEKYKGPLYAYLLRLLGDPGAADDLFQDVFVKVLKKLSVYSERKKFSAWLFTVAHHAVMDHFRSVSRRREDSLDSHDDDRPAAGDTLASPEPGPDELLEAAERAGALRAAFESLSAEQREIFIMRHYSGLSFGEIAVILGVPVGTALARMSRAMAKMRERLQ
jgi:RNA polymerase sigma-70 factor (ECF subfamily)